jgi:hypothetical protein
MTTEERLAKLEEAVAELQALVLAPLPASLEDQHRQKVAARALALAGKTKGER